jgi:hypothetical protein
MVENKCVDHGGDSFPQSSGVVMTADDSLTHGGRGRNRQIAPETTITPSP